MTIPHLKNEFMPYPEPLLEAWKSGDYSMLSRSNASDYIKEILIHKAKIRPGRRFFGESYIASRIDMRDGWYNSFKWLTSKRWITGKSLKPRFEKPFHKALVKHIGLDVLSKLQEKSIRLFEKHKEKFREGDVFRKPVAPDLWLIETNGDFRFIESKLPGDKIGYHQLAGLALIKKYVKVQNMVSVSICNLYPANKQKPKTDYATEFSRLYEMA